MQEEIGENLPLQENQKIYIKEDTFGLNTPKKFLTEYFKNNPATYYANGTIQCDAYRGRSFNDLFILTRTYFPEITGKQLANLLITLERTNKLTYVDCGTVGGAAFHRAGRYSEHKFLSKTRFTRLSESSSRGRYEYHYPKGRVKVSDGVLSIGEVIRLSERLNKNNE